MCKQNVWLLLMGMGFGIVGGIFFPDIMLKASWVGTTFINMLKFICLPLIFCAIVSAIVSIDDVKSLGKMGRYTLIYVFSSVGIAVLIGLVLINVFHPGVGLDPRLIAQATDVIAVKSGFTFFTFIQNLFPDNLIAAAAKFQIMPIVIFAIVFSIACLSVKKYTAPIKDFFTALRHVFVVMISWLMRLAPIGLCSLLGTAVAHSAGDHVMLNGLKGLGLFMGMFIVGLALQVLWQACFAIMLIKKQKKQMVASVAPALITAFATSSSIATLPVALDAAQKLKVSSRISRFVLPLAATVNLSGTAMYEAIAAIFFSQILGIHLTILDQASIFFIAIIAGMGATGIPEGGLVTMVSVLHAVSIPTSAIALLLPFDRILDRFRTMTNVWGDLMCVMVVNYFVSRRQENNIAQKFYAATSNLWRQSSILK